MRLLLTLALAASLSGCAALGLSPNQSIYAAYGGYVAAVEGAAAYANSPQADPAIVHRLNAANQSEPVKQAVKYGRAYSLCLGKPDTVVAGIDCKAFDFHASTASRIASVLRSVTTALLNR